MDKFSVAEATTGTKNKGKVTLELFIEEVKAEGIIQEQYIVKSENESYYTLTANEGYVFEARLKKENDVEINYLIKSDAILATEITLNETTKTLYVGDKLELIATVKPDNTTKKSVDWTSSDTSIATVKNGEVTLLTPGIVVITAKTKDGTKISTSCTITIKERKVEELVKIGDYVKYTPATGISTSSIVSNFTNYSGATNNTSSNIVKDSTLKWKVLNIENDKIELISDKSTNNVVYFNGALGYNNGVKLLNDYCNTIYSNSTYQATARSLNVEDIISRMDLTVWDYHSYVDYEIKYGNTYTFSSAGYRYYPYQWKNTKTEYNKNKINGSTITGTLGQSQQTSYMSTTATQATTSIVVEQTIWSSTMKENNFKTTSTRKSDKDTSFYYEIFINNGSNNINYWLASRYSYIWAKVYASYGIRSVENKVLGGRGTYTSDNTPVNRSNPVRPVVTIPTSVIDVSEEYNSAEGWPLKNI